MARQHRSRGFTLVELLVVITIIGMLVSLLLPAIQAARESGRRNTCMNNMRQAALGLITIAEVKKAFPGYVNPLVKSGTTYRSSWVVEILPALEQNALYQNWKNPSLPIQWNSATAATFNRNQYVVNLGILVCPSNASPDLSDDALSFVANTGIALTPNDNFPSASPSWPEDSASGVFFNHVQGDFTATPPPPIKKVNIDYIASNDGTTNTILISENVQAGRWATDPFNSISPFTTEYAARQSVGMVWYLTGNQDNTDRVTPLPLASNFLATAMGINDMFQTVSGLPVGKYDSMNTSQPTGLAFARPSAFHPGGVNSVCAAGNYRYLSEEIDYKVLTQLMTTVENQVIVDYVMSVPVRANSKQGGGTIQVPKQTGGTNKVLVPWGYILNDADL